ncbi:MAG: RNA 2',3'-cyclic phosphodiesterase, partial [Nitriliruptoraceae bacterium]
MSERTFVALGLPSEPRARLAAATAWLRGQSPGLRPTAPDTWHLTLAFLGPLDEDGQHAVAGHLARVVARAASVPAPWLELDRAGRFGDRVLYVAVRDEPAGRLAALVDALRADLAEAGFALPTTGFQAHITLARS